MTAQQVPNAVISLPVPLTIRVDVVAVEGLTDADCR